MTSSAPNQDYMFGNKVYDFLKFVVMIGIPCAAMLYFLLSVLWDFPHPLGTLGVFATINAVLGILVSISSVSYNTSEGKYDGDLNVTNIGSRKAFTVELNEVPEVLAQKSEVIFKVTSRPLPYK
jgi:hypothetical protein